jgi:hypothetical protein
MDKNSNVNPYDASYCFCETKPETKRVSFGGFTFTLGFVEVDGGYLRRLFLSGDGVHQTARKNVVRPVVELLNEMIGERE